MNVTRRGFLGILGAGAAGVAALPLLHGIALQDALQEAVGRVYSFPKNIVIAQNITESAYFVLVEMDGRKEYYDRTEFYNARHPAHLMPVRVEGYSYAEMGEHSLFPTFAAPPKEVKLWTPES